MESPPVIKLKEYYFERQVLRSLSRLLKRFISSISDLDISPIFPVYGSLLGIMRSPSQIPMPWDDDLDLSYNPKDKQTIVNFINDTMGNPNRQYGSHLFAVTRENEQVVRKLMKASWEEDALQWDSYDFDILILSSSGSKTKGRASKIELWPGIELFPNQKYSSMQFTKRLVSLSGLGSNQINLYIPDNATEILNEEYPNWQTIIRVDEPHAHHRVKDFQHACGSKRLMNCGSYQRHLSKNLKYPMVFNLDNNRGEFSGEEQGENPTV
jgi:hypothetical protein